MPEGRVPANGEAVSGRVAHPPPAGRPCRIPRATVWPRTEGGHTAVAGGTTPAPHWRRPGRSPATPRRSNPVPRLVPGQELGERHHPRHPRQGSGDELLQEGRAPRGGGGNVRGSSRRGTGPRRGARVRAMAVRPQETPRRRSASARPTRPSRTTKPPVRGPGASSCAEPPRTTAAGGRPRRLRYLRTPQEAAERLPAAARVTRSWLSAGAAWWARCRACRPGARRGAP
jgi:hypothetical protein